MENANWKLARHWRLIALSIAIASGLPALGGERTKNYRGLLGASSKKYKTVDGKTLLWAGKSKTDESKSEWYDFTGSPIPPEQLQFGIGKDRILSIDDPLFVDSMDKRLLSFPLSPYRPEKKPVTTGDVMVIGFVVGNEARAYPTALLNRHELVNDRIGGKPVTVGW